MKNQWWVVWWAWMTDYNGEWIGVMLGADLVYKDCWAGVIKVESYRMELFNRNLYMYLIKFKC